MKVLWEYEAGTAYLIFEGQRKCSGGEEFWMSQNLVQPHETENTKLQWIKPDRN